MRQNSNRLFFSTLAISALLACVYISVMFIGLNHALAYKPSNQTYTVIDKDGRLSPQEEPDSKKNSPFDKKDKKDNPNGDNKDNTSEQNLVDDKGVIPDRLKENQSGNPKNKNFSGECKKHHIVWGDTLWDLSRTYDSNVERLAQKNHIKNPDLIYAGDWLCIY